ncbi:MAG TPA: citrate synthase, partial [Acidimicrobiales bacterium]|nr:citrate synthase [Acidimicrobiales bacterium]
MRSQVNQTPPSPQRAVADLMSAPPVTAVAGDSMAEVAVRMEKESLSCVVVVDGERPVGILTERDVVRFVASGEEATSTPASAWMTSEPDTVAPDADAGVAFASLAERGYRHIPVVDGTTLVGVVSMQDLMRVAQIQPMTHPGQLEAPKGLAGVIVADTVVGDVRGQEGFYHYRQYSARELADRRSLEDVWQLLFDGDLPDRRGREAFDGEVRPLRVLPDEVRPLLPAIAGAGADFVALDALRSAVSLTTASLGYRPSLDIDAGALRADALRLCALVPTLCAALYRLARGEDPIEPDPELAHAANYLWMLTGRRPEPEHARAVEQYLISTVDHGFNVSTFTARVITSTGADLGAAVVGAIGALSGPLHGAAPSRALDMLEAIGEPSRAEAWIRSEVEAGGRIMGFGHRVYKTEDPRSALLRELAQRLGGDKAAFAATVERTIVSVLAELKPGRELYANVEFYAGVVMERCGIPPAMFTSTFAASRVIGWCANILEQASDNRIIRPSARYVGPPPPQP